MNEKRARQERQATDTTYALTRRNFFRMAVGSLTALPAVAGGFLVEATEAYADEAGLTIRREEDGGEADSATTKIVLVTANEVGVHVIDTAFGGRQVLAGAEVTLTSRYNGKSITQTTKADGIAIFDITELAEDLEGLGPENLDTFAFNGTITVKCSGYRDFEMALTRVEGGGGVTAATRNLKDGGTDPYPRKVALNEWDILYTENAFLTTVNNDAEQNLELEFLQMPAGRATVLLKDRGTGDALMETSSYVGSDGVLNASFTGKLLQKGNEEAFREDGLYEIEVVQDDKHTICPIQLTVELPPIDDQVDSDSYIIKPIDASAANEGSLFFTWPDCVPILGGQELGAFAPDFPVHVSLNPFGYFQLTVASPSWGYYRDTGTDEQQGWQRFPYNNLKEAWNKGKEDFSGGWEKAKNAYNRTYMDRKGRETTKAIEKVDMFASFKFSVNLQISAIAQWDNEEKYFQGLIVGEVFVLFDSTLFTVNFWVGFIPILISFNVSLSLMFNLGGGFYTLPDPDAEAKKICLDPGKWKLDYSNTGLTVTFNLQPSLSAGIGVRGVGSISVKGSYQITVVMGLTAPGDLDKSIYKLPHWKAGWAANIKVIISAFLFSQSFTVLDSGYREWLDTWDKDKDAAIKKGLGDDDSWKRPDPDLDMFTMLSQLEIIDDATLKSTAEFAGSSSGRRGAGIMGDEDEDDEVLDWDDLIVGYKEVALEDGRTIGYTVYSLRTGNADEDEPQEIDRQETDEQESLDKQESAPIAPIADDDAADDAVPSPEQQSDEQEAPAEQTSESEQEGPVEQAPEDVQESAPVDTIVDDAEENGPALKAGVFRTRTASAKKSANKSANKRPRNIRKPSEVDYDLAGSKAASLAKAGLRRGLDDGSGVAGIGKHGGIKPSADKIIAGNTSGDSAETPYVFGDSHLKIATLVTTVGGTELRVTCTFRIGTVTINNQPRSRIIMTVIDAEGNGEDGDAVAKSYIGYSKPLDFEFSNIRGVKHADLYDYDFDVAFTTSSSEYSSIDMLHFVVVSGKRAYGDDTTIVEASTNLVFSYVNFRASEAFGRISYLVMSISASEALGSGSYDDMYHCISNMRIATDGTDASPHLLVGILDRCSDTAEGVLSDNYGDGTGGTVKTRVTFAIIDQVWEEWWMPDRSDVDDAMDVGCITSGTVLSMKISPKIRGAYTVTLTSTDETYFFVMKLDKSEAVFTSIKMAAVLESGMRLVPWPQEDCFLTTYPSEEYLQELNETGLWKDPDSWDRSKWMLQKAWWEEEIDNPADPTSTTPVLAFEPIGPNGFNIDTFGINASGSFIFWSQAREGNDGRVYDEYGNYEPLDEDDENLYQLMACRVYQGYFSDPFVVAELDHDMADLAIVATRNSASPLEVVSIEHMPSGTDDNGNPIYLHHKANVWYTVVPHVATATAIDCYAPVPFVSAGGTLRFHVTIRNDGNCYLKGCTLEMCLHSATADDEGNVEVSTEAVRVSGSVAKLDICEDTLVESHYNPRDDATGKLENVEIDYTLAPGKCAVYEIRVPIPSDWEAGDKYVSFIASTDGNEDVAKGGSLAFKSLRGALTADEDAVYQTYALEPGEYKPYVQRATPDADKNQTHMEYVTVKEAIANANDIRDAPLTHWAGSEDEDPTKRDSDKRDSGKNGGGTGDSGTSSSGGNKSRSGSGTTPDTGDPTSTAAATVLAGTGAAMAAYGFHRMMKDR